MATEHVSVAPVGTTNAAALSDPLPGRRMVFGIVSLGLLMASIDQTIVATALPDLQRDLHAQVNWSSWTITIYALGQILMMPLAGRISDQYGRKLVFLAAAVLFTITSLCCGLANNIYLLVALRGIQALGGGAFMPSATGLVSDQFGRDRDRALGMFSSIFPIGAIIGPVLGGIFVTYWSWRGIFLVNVPVGVLMLGLGIVFLPSGAPRTRHRLDLVGVALLGVTVLAGMLGISYLGTGTSSALSPGFLVPEVIAVASGIGFARHSARAANPFIPMALIRGRGFGVMNLINFFYGAASLGLSALVPLYAEERYGIKVLDAGTLLTARAVGMISVAALAALALRRTGYRLPMMLGFTVTVVGLILMATKPPGPSPLVWLALSAAVVGIGVGLSTPASNNATLQLAPESAAAVAGLRGMFRQGGSIVSVSIVTALLARSANPGMTQAHVLLIFALIMAGTLFLVRMVPEHHGAW